MLYDHQCDLLWCCHWVNYNWIPLLTVSVILFTSETNRGVKKILKWYYNNFKSYVDMKIWKVWLKNSACPAHLNFEIEIAVTQEILKQKSISKTPRFEKKDFGYSKTVGSRMSSLGDPLTYVICPKLLQNVQRRCWMQR